MAFFIPVPQDFLVPNDPAISEIEFILRGGDGGFATRRRL